MRSVGRTDAFSRRFRKYFSNLRVFVLRDTRPARVDFNETSAIRFHFLVQGLKLKAFQK